jgi:hypothetical protein
MIIPCEEVAIDAEGKWHVVNPRTAYQLPPGGRFPFQANQLPVYLQLVDGFGSFDIGVEMLRVMDDGTRRFVGTSGLARGMAFTPDTRQLPLQRACLLHPVRFRTGGVYEFRVVAAADDRYEALIGQTALLRVTEGRATV